MSTRVRHNDSDSEIKRNRFGRWFVLIGSTVLTWTLIMIPMSFILGFILSFWPTLAIGWVFASWATMEIFRYLIPRYYLITVGQIRAFVTLNPLLSLVGFKGNPNVIYGPGTNVCYPWETRTEKGNVSLDIITIPFTEEVPGKDTQLLSTGSYQFKPDIIRTDRFIGVDAATIQGGAIDLIKAKVSANLADKSADEAKGELEKINDNLYNFFGLNTDDPSSDVSQFEDDYGIHTVKVTLSGIDVPPSVQETRDAIDKANQFRRGLAAMFSMTEEELQEAVKSKNITREQYSDMVSQFAAVSGNATMDVKVNKFSGLEPVATALGVALSGVLKKENGDGGSTQSGRKPRQKSGTSSRNRRS